VGGGNTANVIFAVKGGDHPLPRSAYAIRLRPNYYVLTWM
jgi:hypothetical protein